MKFRKKPVVVEAVEFTQEMWERTKPPPDGVVYSGKDDLGYAYFFCQTLEGPLKVSVGDWIITGVKGEKYPCKPDIFAATYEQA